MDFKGQALAEQVTLIGLIVAGVIAFAVGWSKNDFDSMAVTYGAGVLLVSAVVLPDHRWWPFSRLFNMHPIPWLPPLNPPKPDEQPQATPSMLKKLLYSMLGLRIDRRPAPAAITMPAYTFTLPAKKDFGREKGSPASIKKKS